jgi:uncharacterized protein
MSFSLFPKEVKFFDLFKEQHRKLKKAVHILDDIFQNWREVEDCCTRINIIEDEANAISRKISTELAATFITPLDREDIHHINVTQEALVNIIKAAASRMNMFDFTEITFPAKRLVGNLKVMVDDMGAVLDKLSKGKDATEDIERIKTLKYECEMLLMVGLGELFDQPGEDARKVLYIVKWNHVYGRLELAVDRTEHLIDVLEGVMLKHA